jgi:hypothetical protein
MNTPDDDFIEAVGNTEYAKIKSVDIDRLLRICDGRKAALAEKEVMLKIKQDDWLEVCKENDVLRERLAATNGCVDCGQIDIGQYGEYPCSLCGLPLEHGVEESPTNRTQDYLWGCLSQKSITRNGGHS